jgi:hypothetical protein
MTTEQQAYLDGERRIDNCRFIRQYLSEMRSPSRRARGARTGILIVSILCLALGSPVSPTWGQTDPKPPQNRRIAKAPGNPATDRRTTSEGAVTPEYSSSDADYAVSGLLSRTTTRSDTVDANLPRSTDLTRRLWATRMAAPDPNEDAETRAALNDLIRRIRAVHFEDTTTAPTFSVSAEPTAPTKLAPVPGPAQTPPTRPAEPAPTLSTTVEPAAALTPTTLKKLEDVLQDPNQVRDPLEMAELLFLSGHRAEATIFYERALARTVPNDSSMADDRAWILFQLGNCLRETDMARAKDQYMKLVSEYPGSPWTELAKAHGRLITWYQSAKPQQLITPQESD